MKLKIVALSSATVLGLALAGYGQYTPQTIVGPDTVWIVQPQAPGVPQLTDAQISDLTASIALYPDPLLAALFPATTFVQELTYADRWLEQHPGADEAAIASLPVDDSVKCMIHYPTVLKMMTDHLDWTQSLGLSFAYQRGALMESVQTWRATAVSNGYLFSTPQQEVLRQGTSILIQPPAQASVVYVPTYDPAVVFVRPIPGRPVAHNAITFATNGFSLSFAVNDLDWHGHEVHVPPHGDHGTHGPKVVFVPSVVKPGVIYPSKVLTPQPDRKELVFPH